MHIHCAKFIFPTKPETEGPLYDLFRFAVKWPHLVEALTFAILRESKINEICQWNSILENSLWFIEIPVNENISFLPHYRNVRHSRHAIGVRVQGRHSFRMKNVKENKKWEKFVVESFCGPFNFIKWQSVCVLCLCIRCRFYHFRCSFQRMWYGISNSDFSCDSLCCVANKQRWTVIFTVWRHRRQHQQS